MCVHTHPLIAQIDRFHDSTPVWNDFLKDLIADVRKELVSVACGAHDTVQGVD